MASDEFLGEGLKSLLESARLSYVEYAHQAHLPLTVPAQRPVIIDNDEGTGWQSGYEDLTISSAPQFIFIWTGPGEDWRQSCLDLASDLVGSYSTTLPFWSGGFAGPGLGVVGFASERPDFKDEPNVWAAQRIIVPAAVEYVTSLQNPDQSDPKLSDQITIQTLQLASAHTLQMKSWLPVYGFETADDQLTVGATTVRKLTPQERGALWSQVFGSMNVSASFSSFYSIRASMTLPSHVIEMTTTRPRMARPEVGSYHLSSLCAFYLYGYRLAGYGMLTSASVPAWISYARMGTPVPLRPLGHEQKSLDQESLEAVCRTIKKLSNSKLDQPRSSRDLALHRFFLGSGRENSVDSILDFVMALEGLLLPNDPATRHGDLTYRFRLHGAYYLADSVDERRAIWRELKELYDLRSGLVHGSDYPTPEKITSSLDRLRTLAAGGLLKAVYSHFPRVEDFNALVLGQKHLSSQEVAGGPS